MEQIAAGRTADVFAYGADRVVKLDRTEWNGLSHYEAGIVSSLHDAGLPVPEVFETVTIEGRHGAVYERLDGPVLSEVLARSGEVEHLAEQFVDLHRRIQVAPVPGLPDLVERLHGELDRAALSDGLRAELQGVLAELVVGRPSCLCHFDFHPENVVVADRGWVVIDWLTAANGPAVADLARTVVLRADAADPQVVAFSAAVRRMGQQRRSVDDEQLRQWVRVVAAARLAEGFEGDYAAMLTRIADAG